MQQHSIKTAIIAAALASIAAAAIAQDRPFYQQGLPLTPGSGGDVALPYPLGDRNGNIWEILAGGWFHEEGNTPLISAGATLYINGNATARSNNLAHLDSQTGELVVSNLEATGVLVTRRILFQKRESLIRYIDIIHNSRDEGQTVTVSITSKLNFAVAAMQFVPEAKKPNHNLAWVGRTTGGRSIVELYGGSNAKNALVLDCQQNGDAMTVTAVLNLPAGGEMAILHAHKIVASLDAGVRYATDLKESSLLKNIPAPIRKIIVNFAAAKEWIGDVEMLRGDLLDAVELRNGDRLYGTLKEAAFSLQTFHGPVELPAETVVGIINVGEVHQRQLIVLTDGQILGGQLKKETLDFQLTSGQITRLPLSELNRFGYRKRPGELDEWTFNNPLVLFRAGERIFIKPISAPLDFATRYGKLSIMPDSIAAISFHNDDTGIHEITLIDGTRFSGLLTTVLEVVPSTGGPPVKIPAGSAARLQLAPRIADIDDRGATVHLLNGDLLVGAVTGKLNIENAFATLPINAADIRFIRHGEEKTQDVQILLSDGALLSGQLLEPELNFELKSGIKMKVPMTLLKEYNQPPPTVPPAAAKIEATVK